MADDPKASIMTNDATVARILAATQLTEKAINVGRYDGPEAVANMMAKLYPIIFAAIRDVSRG